MNHCQVTAITNQKGGVGKTTTTINLGVGLAKEGKRVLLIDADPQGSLTIGLGVQKPDELAVSLGTVMGNIIQDKTFDPRKGILHHAEGIDFMPSNIELSGVEISLFNVMSREYVLKTYVDAVRKDYDYVLIDGMPSLGMMAINTLVAADSVIIPSQPSFLSAKGLDLLLRSVSRVKRSISQKLRIDGILLTMVDNRTNNSKDIILSLQQGIGQHIPILKTQIPHSVRASESSLYGKSIFAYDPRGKVTIAYEALAKEVMNIERTKTDRSRNDGIR